MVWGGISKDDCTHFQRRDTGTLTAIFIGMKSSHPLSNLTLVQSDPGSSWCQLMPHIARVYRFLEEEQLPLTGPHICLTTLYLRLSRNTVIPWVQIWEQIPQDTLRFLIKSMHKFNFEFLQLHFGKMEKTDASFSPLIFGVPLNSALCMLIVFMAIKQCGILSFLTHYSVHISIDIQHFPPFRSDEFLKGSFNVKKQKKVPAVFICLRKPSHFHVDKTIILFHYTTTQ